MQNLINKILQRFGYVKYNQSPLLDFEDSDIKAAIKVIDKTRDYYFLKHLYAIAPKNGKTESIKYGMHHLFGFRAWLEKELTRRNEIRKQAEEANK